MAIREQSAFMIPTINDGGRSESFLINRESDIALMNWTGLSGTTSITGVLNNSYGAGLQTANEIKISPSGAIFVGIYCFLHAVSS